jgi:hypothetical protein
MTNFLTEKQFVKEYQSAGKPIDYNPPNIRWIRFNRSIKIKENYVKYDGKSFDYISFQREKNIDVINLWGLFSEIHNNLDGVDWFGNGGRGNEHHAIQLVYEHLTNRLIAQRAIFDPERLSGYIWKNAVVLWSLDPAEQEETKKRFSNWESIERYYHEYKERQSWYFREERIIKYLSDSFKQTERRIERQQKIDPDNPAARKRKARRHLQRLGYDLHISRKCSLSGSKCQIVKLDSGEIVAGQNFELSMDDVERFYKEAEANLTR